MPKRIVGVRFRKSGRMYYFDPGDREILATDGVIVETAQSLEFADVVLTPREVPEEQLVAPLKEILRVATAEDHEIHQRNQELEREAFAICLEKIEQHELDMKLVEVEYSFGGSKITFYFTSDGRVDFRDLVKDLAFVFKTRIELRQIGVRDEAKMLGGLGSCGRPICCKTFLTDFQPVSIKMAKEQKLSLSPTKISGLCGRLMCCLKYEQEAYESMRKLMPRVNREIITPDGRGMVLDNNAITEKTKARVTLSDGTFDVREYHFSEVRKPTTPEEDAQIQKELIQIARSRAEKEIVKEDDFRFVTGALREETANQETESPEKAKQEKAPARTGSNNNRRRPRKKPQAGATPPTQEKTQPQKGAQEKRQNQPRQRPQGQQKDQPKKPQGPRPAQKQGPAQAAAAQGQQPQKPRTNNRRRRGGQNRPRPEGQSPKAE